MNEQKPEKSCDPERWLEEHGDVLFRFALARLRDRTLAEDVVQETLLGAYRNAEQFDGAATERTWLVGILRFKIVDCLRKLERRPIESDEEDFDSKRQFAELPGTWTDPAQELENDEFRVQFRECLSQITPDFAEAFVLREVEENSYEDVCDMLGLTATNLSTRLYRARMQLRKCLQRNWFDGRNDNE